MVKIPFYKVQSIGNDFVLVRRADVGHLDLPELAQKTCHRRFGIGADGLLILGEDLVLRMFNPDGTEDFCGNGLRCAAQMAHDWGWAGTEFSINHLGRTVKVEIEGDTVHSHLPPVTYDPAKIPIAQASELFNQDIETSEGLVHGASGLSTGSAHTVIPCDSLPDDADFAALGHALEHHPLFPERTSVIWVQTSGEHDLRIRIWERGVGETLGCGTGSTAAAADHIRRRGHGGTIYVHNPGGTLAVTLQDWKSSVILSGKAEFVFQGSFDHGSVPGFAATEVPSSSEQVVSCSSARRDG